MSSLVREIVEAILLAMVVFVVIQTSVQNFRVEGSSMHPTLEGGQYLLVNKMVYGAEVPFLGKNLPAVRRPALGDAACVDVFTFQAAAQHRLVRMARIFVSHVALEE